MKKLIIPCLAAVALMSLSACSTTVNERKGETSHSTTTTTEQSTVPASTTTTTETHSQ